jgi:sodium/proline symporter
MPVTTTPVIIACALVYLLICLGIGLWAAKRTRTSADFFVAGKQLGLFVTMIAAVSSVMSGYGFVGGPGLVYQTGSSSFWLTFSATIAWAASVILVGKRLRLMAEARQILTLPDAVAARYGGWGPRMSMAVAILLGVIPYLGTQLIALGLILATVLGLDFLTALTIGVGVMAFYSVAGGIVAGVYTDLFQGVLMLFAAVGVFYYALEAGGGMNEISSTLRTMDPEFIGPWGTLGPLSALSWYLLAVVGGIGQPQGMTKFLMLRNIGDLKWMALLAAPCYAVLSLVWVSIGMSVRSLVERGELKPLESPDLAAPLFLVNYTPEVLTGLVFAGMLAAIMSTGDSFLNLGAAAIARDIPTALRGRPLDNELLWSRVVTVVLLLAAALFALYMQNLIALLGVFGFGTFAAAITPCLAIGLNWKRATARACVMSICISLVLNFGLELANRHGVYSLPNGINVGCFCLFVSVIVFVSVSLLCDRRSRSSLPRDMEAVMDM